MLGFFAIVYAGLGYFCFWKVVRFINPTPHLLPKWVEATCALLALVIGAPIFVFCFVRIIVNPKYRPSRVTFVDANLSGEPGQRSYRTIWSSAADEGKIIG